MGPSPLLPVKRILLKTFLPNHGSYCSGHQVSVIFGTIAHEVAESQLPGLAKQKHSMGNREGSLSSDVRYKNTMEACKETCKYFNLTIEGHIIHKTTIFSHLVNCYRLKCIPLNSHVEALTPSISES